MKSLSLYIAEFIGTFILVFFGTGAVVSNAYSGGVIGHLGICAVFGLVVLSMIYAIGDISGAHINPAVTLGFYLSKLISFKNAFFYIIAQFLGAIAASLLMAHISPDIKTLGETIPVVPVKMAFYLEMVQTFVLMFVVVNLSYGSKQKGITSGIAVGSTVTFLAIIAGPLTGASMNPARSLGPALASGNLTSIWIYLTAPFIGAGIAVAFYSYFFAKDADLNRSRLKNIFNSK